MTLMTNDLNDHFFSRRSLAKTEGDLRWNRRERGPRGTGGRREREKKLELENLGTSAGYGYLPVAQA